MRFPSYLSIAHLFDMCCVSGHDQMILNSTSLAMVVSASNSTPYCELRSGMPNCNICYSLPINLSTGFKRCIWGQDSRKMVIAYDIPCCMTNNRVYIPRYLVPWTCMSLEELRIFRPQTLIQKRQFRPFALPLPGANFAVNFAVACNPLMA